MGIFWISVKELAEGYRADGTDDVVLDVSHVGPEPATLQFLAGTCATVTKPGDRFGPRLLGDPIWGLSMKMGV